MFEIFVQKRFSAAHRLLQYPGNCARMHGHNWDVTVFLQAHTLNELGIAADFREIKDTLGAILDELDHRDLNDHPEFAKHNPTSERIAQFLFHRLSEQVNNETVRVARVQVSEAPGTGAIYYEP